MSTFDVPVQDEVTHAVQLGYAHVRFRPELDVASLADKLSRGVVRDRGKTTRQESEESTVAVALGNIELNHDLKVLTGRVGQVLAARATQVVFDRLTGEFVTASVSDSIAVASSFLVDLESG